MDWVMAMAEAVDRAGDRFVDEDGRVQVDALRRRSRETQKRAEAARADSRAPTGPWVGTAEPLWRTLGLHDGPARVARYGPAAYLRLEHDFAVLSELDPDHWPDSAVLAASAYRSDFAPAECCCPVNAVSGRRECTGGAFALDPETFEEAQRRALTAAPRRTGLSPELERLARSVVADAMKFLTPWGPKGLPTDRGLV